MASPVSTIGEDFDLENIASHHDLVTFEDISSSYPAGQDLFLIYSVGVNIHASSRDWVGLYPRGWTCIADYLTFQWAPKLPRDDSFPHLRSVLFQAKDIKVEHSQSQLYQFIYITKHKEIIGSSRPFSFHDDPFGGTDPGLQCIERPLEGFQELTFIEYELNRAACVLDSFEVIAREFDIHQDPAAHRSAKKTVDHQTLAADLDSMTCTSLCTDLELAIDLDPVENKSNPERALVRVDSKDRALVPYQPTCVFSAANDDPHLVSELHVLLHPGTVSRLIEELSQGFHHHTVRCAWPGVPSIERPLVYRSPRLPARCISCRNKRNEIRLLRNKYRDLRHQVETLNAESDELTTAIITKDHLLEELASQLRYQVHDNRQLTRINQDLHKRTAKQAANSNSSRLRAAKAAEGRMRMLKAKMQQLSNKCSHLQAQLESAERLHINTAKDHSTLQSSNELLQNDFNQLKTERQQLEQFLDDIMYTLSVYGISGLKDVNGNITDLGERTGRVMDLEGWSLAATKRMERLVAALAAHDKALDDLREERTQLGTHITNSNKHHADTQHMLQEERCKNDRLQSEIEQLSNSVTTYREKEASLSSLLMAEKLRSQVQGRQLETRTREMGARMERLQQSLMSSGLLKQTLQTETSCQATGPSTHSAISQTSVTVEAKSCQVSCPVNHSSCQTVTSLVTNGSNQTLTSPTSLVASCQSASMDQQISSKTSSVASSSLTSCLSSAASAVVAPIVAPPFRSSVSLFSCAAHSPSQASRNAPVMKGHLSGKNTSPYAPAKLDKMVMIQNSTMPTTAAATAAGGMKAGQGKANVWVLKPTSDSVQSELPHAREVDSNKGVDEERKPIKPEVETEPTSAGQSFLKALMCHSKGQKMQAHCPAQDMNTNTVCQMKPHEEPVQFPVSLTDDHEVFDPELQSIQSSGEEHRCKTNSAPTPFRACGWAARRRDGTEKHTKASSPYKYQGALGSTRKSRFEKHLLSAEPVIEHPLDCPKPSWLAHNPTIQFESKTISDISSQTNSHAASEQQSVCPESPLLITRHVDEATAPHPNYPLNSQGSEVNQKRQSLPTQPIFKITPHPALHKKTYMTPQQASGLSNQKAVISRSQELQVMGRPNTQMTFQQPNQVGKTVGNELQEKMKKRPAGAFLRNLMSDELWSWFEELGAGHDSAQPHSEQELLNSDGSASSPSWLSSGPLPPNPTTTHPQSLPITTHSSASSNVRSQDPGNVSSWEEEVDKDLSDFPPWEPTSDDVVDEECAAADADASLLTPASSSAASTNPQSLLANYERVHGGSDDNKPAADITSELRPAPAGCRHTQKKKPKSAASYNVRKPRKFVCKVTHPPRKHLIAPRLFYSPKVYGAKPKTSE